MYLAVMLIVVSILVFYNEITNKMSLAEILLMVVALLAIIRAALNYIKLNDMITPAELKSSIQRAIPIEGFSNRKSKVKSRGNNSNNRNDGLIQLMSQDAKEYFDADKDVNITNPITNTDTTIDSKIDKNAVGKVNALFENPVLNKTVSNNIASNKASFDDIPPTTTFPATTSAARRTGVPGIESIFVPKIVIGSGDHSGAPQSGNQSGDNTAATSGDDALTFPNTMRPSRNLWASDLDTADLGEWSQNMDAYNHGRWNPRLYQRPSDYTDYYMPSAYGMSTQQHSTATNTTSTPTNTTPTNAGTTDAQNRRCGQYDSLDVDQAGNMLVRNYTESKKWVPGYTYVPPVYWDVPQRHVSVCQPDGPNVRKLTGLVDRGLPLNVLELNQDGSQAQNEDDVHLTNVGSILPRFGYQEAPFSKPYV